MSFYRLGCLLLVLIIFSTTALKSFSEIEPKLSSRNLRHAKTFIASDPPANDFKEEVLPSKNLIQDNRKKRKGRKNKSAILQSDPKEKNRAGLLINFKDYRVPVEPYESLLAAETVKEKLEKAALFLEFISQIYSLNKLSTVFEVARCPTENQEFKPVNDDLSQFDLKMYSELRVFRQQFTSIFDQIFRSLPHTFLKRLVKNSDQEKDFLKEEIGKAIQKVRPEYIGFRNAFSVRTKSIEGEFLKLECGMKDFTSFYSVLPRFYWAYKKEIARNEKQEDFFTELAVLKMKWLNNLNNALCQYYLLKSWISILGDTYLHFNDNPRDDKLLEYFAFFKQHLDFITASKSTWRKTQVQFKNIDDQLRKIIKNIEKKNEMPEADFPDFAHLYIA